MGHFPDDDLDWREFISEEEALALSGSLFENMEYDYFWTDREFEIIHWIAKLDRNPGRFW